MKSKQAGCKQCKGKLSTAGDRAIGMCAGCYPPHRRCSMRTGCSEKVDVLQEAVRLPFNFERYRKGGQASTLEMGLLWWHEERVDQGKDSPIYIDDWSNPVLDDFGLIAGYKPAWLAREAA